MTSLHLAAHNDKSEALRMLLDQGADPNSASKVLPPDTASPIPIRRAELKP